MIRAIMMQTADRKSKHRCHPVWCQPEAPLGSAVRYIASLSPRFSWVGISVRKGNRFLRGPELGRREVEDQLVVPFFDGAGKILGKIKIASHLRDAFSAVDKKRVERIAAELGALWSA